ncbi:LacI family DNA-binding transcriptional regulator [Nesterenkonia ebinurensis]|uniref:LacI family DNA-binding transcriptional regulator n=1 Tax=Nesterenkonia ebinurensis TaxID=2608252 RepID=UPI00123E2E70|nr:LacI family DNA-binding transcriptional regulator [Nesterenkonia ebinurensis]
MPPQHQVTLAQVAEAAGVSIATASRAINGSTRKVSEVIRARVRRTAEELGYLPNLSAQTVVKGASPTVAVLVSDIADPYFSAISSGIMAGARQAGLMVTMATSERRSADERDMIRTFRSQRPRAIVVVGSRWDEDPEAQAIEEQLTAYQQAGGRVVMVSQGPSPFDLVEIQNVEGARALAHALVDQGGQHFGVVLGYRGLRTNADRLAGFAQGLAERGITLQEETVAEGAFTRDGGYAAMGELLGRDLELDTVFATSDLMAFGAGTAMREAGLQPGVQIGLAGFDNIALSEDVTPALTTVDVPLGQIGRHAMDLALSDHEEARTIEIPTSVILRASTPVR